MLVARASALRPLLRFRSGSACVGGGRVRGGCRIHRGCRLYVCEIHRRRRVCEWRKRCAQVAGSGEAADAEQRLLPRQRGKVERKHAAFSGHTGETPWLRVLWCCTVTKEPSPLESLYKSRTDAIRQPIGGLSLSPQRRAMVTQPIWAIDFRSSHYRQFPDAVVQSAVPVQTLVENHARDRVGGKGMEGPLTSH
jgi:hypothetical protein